MLRHRSYLTNACLCPKLALLSISLTSKCESDCAFTNIPIFALPSCGLAWTCVY